MDAVIPKIEISPVNGEFLAYLASEKAGELQTCAENGCQWGEIPPVFDFSYAELPKVKAVTLPAYYDLRSSGRVTGVKNQRPLRTCWAFAAYGSLESCLLPGETTDFSENNLVNEHGFDFGPNRGGNYLMAAAYLTRWSGPVKEEDDPYTGEIHSSPPGLTAQKHVQEVILFPKWELEWGPGTEGHESLKQAVMNFGAVDASMHWDNGYYNENTYSYYYGSSGSKNHAVCIIGWDDDFDKQRFAPSIPPGNGAYIVRNSRGSDWGDEGYFYLSYHDPNVLPRAIFISAEDTGNFKRIYQYDPLGLVSTVYVKNSPTIWAANVFDSAAGELLSAVSFYTFYPDTEYEVRIYTGGRTGPTGGFVTSIERGAIMLPGYHTVPLSCPVSLITGARFSVVVRLSSKAGDGLAAIEKRVRGYTGRSLVKRGKSYASTDGTHWVDLYDTEHGNACIKAFTKEPLITADLSVAMECTGPVSVGTPLVYAAKVINNGSNPVTGLTLIDSLPDGVTLNSVTPGQGAFEVYDRVVVCNMGNLANGATASVIIEVTPVIRGDVTNNVSVTANEYDPDPDNNRVTQSAAVPQTDGIVSGNVRNSRGTRASVRINVTCTGLTPAGDFSGSIDQLKNGKALKYIFSSSHADSIKTYRKGKYLSLQAAFTEVTVTELTGGVVVTGCTAAIRASGQRSGQWSGFYEITYPDGRELRIFGMHSGSIIILRQVSCAR